MSGIEIAGLALGAIPVILEAIKGYQSVHTHIQDFKQAHKHLKIVNAQFQVCKLNFTSECRLLLELVISPGLSQALIADTQHALWGDEELKKQLAAQLRDSAEACVTIVTDTTKTIKEFDDRLSKFESQFMSNAFLQRARVSAGFMMEKKRFEKDIEVLRKRNADFNLLRTHFSSRDNSSRSQYALGSHAQDKVERFSTVRLASKMLHDTIKKSWSCLDSTHLRHWTKLCVDCDSQTRLESVNLDIAISSEKYEHEREKCFPTVWLCVKSESFSVSKSSAMMNQQGHLQSLSQCLQSSSTTQSTSPTKVTAPSPSFSASNAPTQPPIGVDLCKVACICSHLRSNATTQSSTQRTPCFGYLESPSDFRHLFFAPSIPTNVLSPSASATSSSNFTPLTTVIAQSRPEAFLHQFQLALKISKSVLQFHNTSWLPSAWNSADLSILGSVMDEDSLKTLHLSSCFAPVAAITPKNDQILAGHGISTAASSSTTATVSLSSSVSSGKILSHAVYNETLFCLGVVLLEISHWQTFESLCKGDADEFNAAHRLSQGHSPLGPRYRKIVERCLRCNFGTDKEDLQDLGLQQAVWAKVVFPLEALVQAIGQEGD